MKRIINLAWKNIWRNKVRSGVILGAITIGLFSGTYMTSYMMGWIIGTVKDDIKTNISHIQIHDTAFVANSDINACFLRETVEKKIQTGISQYPHTEAYRLNLTGMLASSHNAIGITAVGVNKDEEMQVTNLWQFIPDTLGEYLPNDAKMPIVISKRMADKLKVKLKSKIVFTFQDINGDMQSMAFRVCGIYKTTNATIDETNVFVRYSDVIDATGLPDGAVHEVAILLPDIEICDIVTPQLKNLFSDFDVQDWKEINPALSMYFSYVNFMGMIFLGIFLFALSFGIINTMLMAVLERKRELGMLGAIGMSKRNIFSMIMLETVFLTLFGSITGVILAVVAILPSMETGIDLSFVLSNMYEDYGFSAILYPMLNLGMFVQIVVLVIVAGIMSAIYPARKALKIKSLEAIREV